METTPHPRCIVGILLAAAFAIAPAHAQNFGNITLNVSDASPRIGRELTLSARLPVVGGSWLYTFLYRYDNENRWTQIRHRVPAPEIKWTPPKGGNVELRVDAVAPGREEMRHTVRAHVRTGNEPVRFTGSSPMEMRDFPPYPEAVGLHMDKAAGVLGEAREIQIRLATARNGRRITFMVKHQSDRDWRIIRENSDTLSFRWSPDKVGSYQIRVDTGAGSLRERAQISFTCLDPNAPAGVRMRGR